MPGMRKAALARRKRRMPSRPRSLARVPADPAIFGIGPTPVALDRRVTWTAAGISDRSGLPELRIAYDCTEDEERRHNALLAEATGVQLVAAATEAGPVTAVDLMQGDTVLGRMFTSLNNPDLSEVVAAVEGGAQLTHVSIHRGTIVEPDEDADLELPVSVKHVSFEQLCGEPVRKGTGWAVNATIDHLTAACTLTRFETYKAADRALGSAGYTPGLSYCDVWDDLLLFDDLMRNTTTRHIGGDSYVMKVVLPRFVDPGEA